MSLLRGLTTAIGFRNHVARQRAVGGGPGVRHRGCPAVAKAEHYPVVGSALLWTLEKGLGDGWTPAVADAWTTAYGTLSGYMISEAYGRSQAAE
jgi:hypothetical protein